MQAIDRAAKWEQNWFGFWGLDAQADAAFPGVDAFVDLTWNPDDKEKLIEYLITSPIAVATCAGYQQCLKCSASFEIGAFGSDDVWLWPNDLPHYVHAHSIVLPLRLLQHIRRNNYRPPSKLTVPLSQLPWPRIDAVRSPEASC